MLGLKTNDTMGETVKKVRELVTIGIKNNLKEEKQLREYRQIQEEQE